MPQHKSAAKRVRQNAKRHERNRTHRSRLRTMIKTLESTEEKAEAEALLDDVKAYVDRLTTKGIIHKNKGARYKSQLEKHVNALG
ncbi:MAG: 30S ribosomal protein S20 [Bacteroidetes bacterium]|jgi:small subunit ribosomal protein S20|nr:30S ribosomal protein S20 [Bacteroidota bacterium]